MQNEQSGSIILPADGQVIPNPLGARMVVKVRDADTGGAYSVHENVLPAGTLGPRPHRHRDHDEAFYVLEGTLTIRMGADTATAPAGSFVLVPRGVVHQPSNPGAVPVRALLFFSPAGMDRFFIEAAERRLPLQAVPTDPAVVAELAEFTARYGFEFAEFPAERSVAAATLENARGLAPRSSSDGDPNGARPRRP